MFNPKNIPVLKEKYRELLDIRSLSWKSTEREVLYSSYFGLIERINAMVKFEAEVNLCIDDVKPFITHNNKDIQELLYGCYQVLKGIVADIPVRIKELESLKVDVIEAFNKNFENNKEVKSYEQQ